jgi:hypothetical protein
VLVRARMNSCLVEFDDGYRVVTSGLSASIVQWISERGARMARRDD